MLLWENGRNLQKFEKITFYFQFRQFLAHKVSKKGIFWYPNDSKSCSSMGWKGTICFKNDDKISIF